MIVKRMLPTARCCMAGLGASVVLLTCASRLLADVVTGISNLSQTNRLSIFHDYSIDAVGLTTRSSVPGSAGGGVMGSVLGSWASTDQTDSGRVFDISVAPLFGYDSNPEARRVAEGSVFGGADLTALYRINIGPDDATVGSPTQFRISYDATGAVYDGTVFHADTFQQTLSGSYRRSLFRDTLFVGIALADQFTTESGNAYLNTFDASPSFEWFLTPEGSAEVNYDFTRLDYFIRAATRRNPDADRHTVNVKFHFYPTPQLRGDIPESEDVLGDILRQTLERATVGYAAVFNNGVGSDYRYEANRASIGVEGVHLPHLRDVVLDATYAHEWDNFTVPNAEGPNVLAGKPKQVRRKDHLDVFTLRANARLFDLPQNRGTLSTFVQWDLIADRANLEARHFNEFIISGGIRYQY